MQQIAFSYYLEWVIGSNRVPVVTIKRPLIVNPLKGIEF